MQPIVVAYFTSTPTHLASFSIVILLVLVVVICFSLDELQSTFATLMQTKLRPTEPRSNAARVAKLWRRPQSPADESSQVRINPTTRDSVHFNATKESMVGDFPFCFWALVFISHFSGLCDVSEFVGSRTWLDTAVSFSSFSCGSRKHHITSTPWRLEQVLPGTLPNPDPCRRLTIRVSLGFYPAEQGLQESPQHTVCSVKSSHLYKGSGKQRGAESWLLGPPAPLLLPVTVEAICGYGCQISLTIRRNKQLQLVLSQSVFVEQLSAQSHWTIIQYMDTICSKIPDSAEMCQTHMMYIIFAFSIISFRNCSCNFYRDSAGKRDQFHLMAISCGWRDKLQKLRISDFGRRPYAP